MDKNEIKTGKETAPEKTNQSAGVKMPALLTVQSSPHIKSPETTTTVMFDVILALLPAYIWGIAVFGWRALALGAVSIISCVGLEALTQFLLHRPITVRDLSAAVTGLLLAMNLPVTVPLWMPVIGAFFAIVVVKQIFGGIGKNFVNPALAARVFLFSWADKMSAFPAFGSRVNSVAAELGESDIIAGATPLASLKNGVLPETNLFDMIIGNVSGCVGEVSSILLIAGGLYLLMRRVITWHIPVAYIGTVAVLTFLSPKGSLGPQFMLYELFAGGLMLGAIFMATDYSTSPVTINGRLLYGVGCGAITVLIRYFGSYPEGVSFAILIMNLLVFYIDKATMPRPFGAVGRLGGKKRDR